MYRVPQGVTSYINDMERTDYSKHMGIRNWEDDLRRLKQLRHKRNYLAHEGSFDEPLCTQEDIVWLTDFYDRIMRHNDPLAQMHLQKQRRPQKKTAEENALDENVLDVEINPRRPCCFLFSKFILGVIFAAIVFLFSYFIRFL